jgi:hypothetical protein
MRERVTLMWHSPGARTCDTNVTQLRDGDLGENAGESFFPTSETEQNCNGEEIPTEPIMRLGMQPTIK